MACDHKRVTDAEARDLVKQIREQRGDEPEVLKLADALDGLLDYANELEAKCTTAK